MLRGHRRFCFGHPVRGEILFNHMCLYPKCSDFSGEFKNAQSDLLLLLGLHGWGQDKLNNFASKLPTWENTDMNLWVKLGYPRQYTHLCQMNVGRPNGLTDFGNASAVHRAKKCQFSLGTNLCVICLVSNVGKRGFDFMGAP